MTRDQIATECVHCAISHLMNARQEIGVEADEDIAKVVRGVIEFLGDLVASFDGRDRQELVKFTANHFAAAMREVVEYKWKVDREVSGGA